MGQIVGEVPSYFPGNEVDATAPRFLKAQIFDDIQRPFAHRSGHVQLSCNISPFLIRLIHCITSEGAKFVEY
jgi:hypothetical protein